MKRNPRTKDAGWNISFWFAVSSPAIGVLVAILALLIFCRGSEQAMSITPIVLVLIILLFGLDSTEQGRTGRQHNG
jgi:hypothetical protein